VITAGSIWVGPDDDLYKVIKVRYDDVVSYTGLNSTSKYIFMLSSYGFVRYFRPATKLDMYLYGN
jgi:hypothetical protein